MRALLLCCTAVLMLVPTISKPAYATELGRLAAMTSDARYLRTEQGKIFEVTGENWRILRMSERGRSFVGARLICNWCEYSNFCTGEVYLADLPIILTAAECLPDNGAAAKKALLALLEEKSKPEKVKSSDPHPSDIRNFDKPTASSQQQQASSPQPTTSWLYWSVRLYPKAIGADAHGDKVYCYKCTGPHWHLSYPDESMILVCDSYAEAKEKMKFFCDCP